VGTEISDTAVPARKPMSRRQSIGLVLLCTVLGAVGQIVIKMGANTLTRSSPWAMVTNPYVFSGYCLYGLMTVLFIYALRDEELSFVYPIISLTYVWVSGLSVWFFHDAVNAFRLIGVAAIVAGVFVLGKDARK
jgi:drug/metabolite transporter (DMT)-like permease